MTSFQSGCLVIFGVLAYLMWVDENVAIYLTLIFKIIRVNIERVLWMIRFHPRNPITNLVMKWKYDKIARQLQKEYDASSLNCENPENKND